MLETPLCHLVPVVVDSSGPINLLYAHEPGIGSNLAYVCHEVAGPFENAMTQLFSFLYIKALKCGVCRDSAKQ